MLLNAVRIVHDQPCIVVYTYAPGIKPVQWSYAHSPVVYTYVGSGGARSLRRKRAGLPQPELEAVDSDMVMHASGKSDAA